MVWPIMRTAETAGGRMLGCYRLGSQSVPLFRADRRWIVGYSETFPQPSLALPLSTPVVSIVVGIVPSEHRLHYSQEALNGDRYPDQARDRRRQYKNQSFQELHRRRMGRVPL